jgi:oligoribonuclease
MSTPETREPTFLFLDLETTGLSPDNDRILEVGMVITDANLTTISTFGQSIQWSDIYYHMGTDTYLPPFTVDNVVVEMHTKSGLWEDCYRSKKKESEVWNDAIHFVQHHCGDHSKDMWMIGNTIGFDRSFLHHWVPGFNELFHYRSVDISSVEILYNLWVGGEKDVSKPKGNKLHRAVPDCLDSIQKARYYQHVIFDRVGNQ